MSGKLTKTSGNKTQLVTCQDIRWCMEQIVDYKWSGCGLLVFYKVYLKVSALVSSYFQTNFTILIPIHWMFNWGFSHFHIWTLHLQEHEGAEIALLCIVWIHNLLFLKTTILTFPRLIPGFLVWFLSRETLEQSQVGRLLNIINSSVPSALRKSAETPESGVSSQKAAQTLRILIKIIKNSDICELFNILM